MSNVKQSRKSVNQLRADLLELMSENGITIDGLALDIIEKDNGDHILLMEASYLRKEIKLD